MKERIQPIMESNQYLREIQTHAGSDGSLSVVDFEDPTLPFRPQRIFYLHGIGKSVTRGKHAHKKCKQLFIPLSGSCKLNFVNKSGSGSHILNSPCQSFLAEELTWCEISDFSEGSVLLIIASEPYDANDYIHDFATFESKIQALNDSNF